MKRPISSKPDTCTEGLDLDGAGISVKVARITLGGLISCHVKEMMTWGRCQHLQILPQPVGNRSSKIRRLWGAVQHPVPAGKIERGIPVGYTG